MAQAQQQISESFRPTNFDFCIGTKVTENTEVVHLKNDTRKIFPRKYLWIIHSINPNTARRSVLSLVDHNSEVKIEFQSINSSTQPPQPNFSSGQFRMISYVYANKPKRLIEGLSAKVVICHGSQAQSNYSTLSSSPASCKTTPTIFEFYNQQTLVGILSSPYLYQTFQLNGRIFNNALIVMVELGRLNGYIIPTSEEYTQSIMNKIYNKLNYADLEVKVQFERDDGTRSEMSKMVHKVVLSASSTVFETIFQSNFIEREQSFIEIIDFEPKTVEELLKYLYTGQADFSNYAIDLLKISDKYDVQDLLKVCQKYISENILKFGWECVMGLLQIYDERIPILRVEVKEYFKMHEMLLRNSPEFQTVIRKFPDAFFGIYCS